MHHRGLLQSYQRRLAGEAMSCLAGIVGYLMPKRQLDCLRKSGSRQCIFTPIVTFWSFLAQVLSPEQSCREAVRQVQATRKRRRKSGVCSGSSAYCQARWRLSEGILQAIWESIAVDLSDAASPKMRWQGLRVGVVDGTTVSMPDNAANQAEWPQSRCQKTGCGFPIMKLVGLFSLATGSIHKIATGNLHDSEQSLFCQLWNTLINGFDLLLGDRGFGSFAMFGALYCNGLHGVFRLHQRRKTDWRNGKRLGKYDRIVTWNKPDDRTIWWLPEPMPQSLQIRILKVVVPIAGFRTRVVFISTNLLDSKKYPPETIAELYWLRWQVELFFRHIKTAMHMDVLRCKSPKMIRRELHMHMIAYNVIRALMLQAALLYRAPLCRISFKGTCDALRQWAPHLVIASAMPQFYSSLFRSMLRILAGDLVPLRPNRVEPRALKRRPKPYSLLNKPRHLLRGVK